MSKTRKATLLDVDPSIIENNLLLESNRDQDKEIERLFPNLTDNEPPSKLVRPTPGFCIKTRKADGTKVFINVCHTDAIPPPEDISEGRLSEILRTDEATDFRVPMSIGNPREEPDKSGKPSDVYDVAVNDAFLRRTEGSALFRSFLFQVVFEAVQQKYQIELEADEFVVLKNRKAMGVLQQHRIQQRDANNKPARKARPLISEISPLTSAAAPLEMEDDAPTVETRVEDTKPRVAAVSIRQPTYRLIHQPSSDDQPEQLVGEFKMSDVASAKELALDVGEDRITLESRRRSYLLDIFVPLRLDANATSAKFDVNDGMLTVTMPIVTVA